MPVPSRRVRHKLTRSQTYSTGGTDALKIARQLPLPENDDTENDDTENDDTENDDTENDDTENDDTENNDTENNDTENNDTWKLFKICIRDPELTLMKGTGRRKQNNGRFG